MQTALKAIAALQTVQHPSMFSLKRNVPKSFFQKSAILSSVEEDRFAFDMIDANHNQQINAKEFSDFLTAFGEPTTVMEGQMYINWDDMNGDNQLDFDEWHAANNPQPAPNNPQPDPVIVRTWTEEDEQTFISADTNGDGFLTSAEIQQFVFIYGGEDIDIEEVDLAVAYFDSNGDNRLNRAEWARWIDQGALVQKKSMNLVAKNTKSFLKKPMTAAKKPSVPCRCGLRRRKSLSSSAVPWASVRLTPALPNTSLALSRLNCGWLARKARTTTSFS